MEETNEFQKQALNTLAEEAPDLLEMLGRAMRKDARIVDMKVELAVPLFDGSEASASIDLDGDVEWEM